MIDLGRISLNKMNINQLGHLIKEARKAQNLTQLDLRDLSGVSASVLYKLENGRTDVSLNSLLAVAEALGIQFTAKSPLGREVTLHE